MDMGQADAADVIVFQRFGIAILNAAPDRRKEVAESTVAQGIAVEPEYWKQQLGMISADSDGQLVDTRATPDSVSASLAYLRGYRDALTRALETIERRETAETALAAAAANFADSDVATWGLQVTGVVGSSLTGNGIKVAVLDTGFDITHPDFRDRNITSSSFIPETTQVEDRLGRRRVIAPTDRSATIDQAGHGTHCIGTACGPLNPERLENGQSVRRYGIAHGAEIFNGKVLSILPGDQRASGKDGWIIAGIEWAVQNGCSIISMSLGSEVALNENYPTAYEDVAKQALLNGVVLFAAAGNDSKRGFGIFRPVGSPANCPSIYSVGAVQRAANDVGYAVADFSNRHLNDQGGEINFSGPGQRVFSSYPLPQRTAFLDGTSQATPHVAGIAALMQQETGKTGRALYEVLRERVANRQLPPSVDFGNGLIHV